MKALKEGQAHVRVRAVENEAEALTALDKLRATGTVKRALVIAEQGDWFQVLGQGMDVAEMFQFLQIGVEALTAAVEYNNRQDALAAAPVAGNA